MILSLEASSLAAPKDRIRDQHFTLKKFLGSDSTRDDTVQYCYQEKIESGT
jgi:hypothetical protein